MEDLSYSYIYLNLYILDLLTTYKKKKIRKFLIKLLLVCNRNSNPVEMYFISWRILRLFFINLFTKSSHFSVKRIQKVWVLK